MLRRFLPYALLIYFLLGISTVTRFLFAGSPEFFEDINFQLFVFGSILFVGYYINRIAPKTVIPSFVWSIFAGMAMQPILGFYTHQIDSFKVTMEVIAAFILFAGGLEVPFNNFRKWFLPITSLSLVGVIVSSLIFSLTLYFLVGLFNQDISTLIPSILILSAALASTDPTAIIPTLKALNLKRGFLKQIAVSESALTDVSGSILTRFLIIALISVPIAQGNTIFTYIAPLLRKATYDALALQIISGILIGYLGYLLINKFYRSDKSHLAGHQADPALLLSIPLFTFVLGNLLGGAGFLASFTAGLFCEIQGNLKHVSRFYDSILNHLLKPFIFIYLGALVPINILIANAPLGILAGILFIAVIRPFVIFITLLPWFINRTFKFTDLLFLSLIRETGIIAAILIIISASQNIIQSDFVISIGMWVILLTLIVEPPLRAYFTKKFGLTN